MLKCFVYNVKKMYILVIRNCTRKSIFWLINEPLQLYRHFSPVFEDMVKVLTDTGYFIFRLYCVKP